MWTLVCDNRVKAQSANAPLHFELSESDYCTFAAGKTGEVNCRLPCKPASLLIGIACVHVGDAIGWYHERAGIIDFDTGGNDVHWQYPMEALKIGETITFATGGQRTYSVG